MQINVLEYLEHTAAQCPDGVAVKDAGGAYTFAQLRSAALALASALAARQDTVCTPVGVYLPKSKECILSFAAILYSGNIYAPLDVKSPVPRLAAILETLAPSLVITNARFRAAVVQAGFPESAIVLIEEAPPALDADAQAAIANRRERIIDADPAYIIHTSGSTGTPKGVIIPHRGIIDYIDWANSVYRVDSSTVIGNQAPFHFDNSTLDIYLSFSRGATLVLIPDEMFLFPVKLIEYLRQENIDFIFWVPSVLVNVANLNILASVPLPPLGQILFAGEVMPVRQLNYWRQWFPRALFSNLYGPTEITVDCTYYLVEREFDPSEPLPIGFACRNTDVLILTEDNRQAGPGERGELCVRGSSLALGYWNNPERTAAAFTQNPLHDRYPERIYRTGDIVYRNDLGEIIYAGRNDFQIKHLGYRIELGEIETAVMSLEPVRNACVLYDKTNSQIVLYFESDRELDARYLRTELGRLLPKYMLPAVCNRMAALPMNANGKIDRPALTAAMGGAVN